MKKIILIPAILFSLFIIAFLPISCKKAVKENPKWEGTWKTTAPGMYVTTLDMDPFGKGIMKKCENNGQMFVQCETLAEGRATIKNKKLRIGGTAFKIDQEPTEDSNGKSYIILEGITYVK